MISRQYNEPALYYQRQAPRRYLNPRPPTRSCPNLLPFFLLFNTTAIYTSSILPSASLLPFRLPAAAILQQLPSSYWLSSNRLSTLAAPPLQQMLYELTRVLQEMPFLTLLSPPITETKVSLSQALPQDRESQGITPYCQPALKIVADHELDIF